MSSCSGRCEVTAKGLPPAWSDEEIEALFVWGRTSSHEGEVMSVLRLQDPSEATVIFTSRQCASDAIQELNGLDLTEHEGGGVLSLKLRVPPKPSCAPHLAKPSPAPRGSSQTAAKESENLDALEDTCMVQLRGLPFRATVADIESFLGEYVKGLAVGAEPAIRLLQNRDGRPSGFARVRFDSPEAANACCASLHRQEMGDRYIEVLPASDRKSKALRCALRGGVAVDPDIEVGNQDDVLKEIRAFLRAPGQHQSKLSLLGGVLSPESRAYLRQPGLGLKQILTSLPNEFHVHGPRGNEEVVFLPATRARPKSDAASRGTVRKAQDQPETPGGSKRSHMHLNPENHPGAKLGKEVPMVRLRGLPFSVTTQEIFDFFVEHDVDHCISEAPDAVELLPRANGRPSGQAVVQVRSHEESMVVQERLNKQFIGERYVEVFAYGG